MALEEVAGGVVIGLDARIVLVSQCGTSWSLPKGHVEPGEDLRATARREIAEESGLTDLAELAELGEYQRSAIAGDGSIDESRRKRITLFLYRTSQQALRSADPQNPDVRWVHLDEAIELLTHPADAARLRELDPLLEPYLRAIAAQTASQRAAAFWPGIPEAVLRAYSSVLTTKLEDLTPGAKLVLDKPYGINVIVHDIEGFGVSVARLKPGRSSSFHYHRQRREFFTVRSGTLTVNRGATHDTLHRFEAGSSTPGLPHAIENNGACDMEIAELFSPFMLDDKFRISDRYQRKLGDVHHLD